MDIKRIIKEYWEQFSAHKFDNINEMDQLLERQSLPKLTTEETDDVNKWISLYLLTDWFQIGKGVRQGCILSPCLFNLYAEYMMRIAGLEEAQAGIKISRRNINNLRYADDTTLMAESEEELKSLLWKWKRKVTKLA